MGEIRPKTCKGVGLTWAIAQVRSENPRQPAEALGEQSGKWIGMSMCSWACQAVMWQAVRKPTELGVPCPHDHC